MEQDEKFRSINRETARVISAVTGSRIKITESEENVDMCKAIQDIRLEGIAIGEARGEVRGKEQERQRMVTVMAALLRSMGMTEEEIIEKIADSTGISEEDIFRYVCGGSGE